MSIVQLFKQNTRFRSSFLTMMLALLALISMLVAMFQVTAWFKNYQSTSTDALLTNFTTETQYSTDGGVNWTTLTAGNPIPLDDTDDHIQVRIVYTGNSSALLRVSLLGSFQNADTETYLPQLDDWYSVSETNNWVNDGAYHYYFTKVLGDKHDETQSIGAYSNDEYTNDEYTLDIFEISFDPTKLSDNISKHQDYQGKLYVIVDTVQPDRYKAFWDLDELPFTLSDNTTTTTIALTE